MSLRKMSAVSCQVYRVEGVGRRMEVVGWRVEGGGWRVRAVASYIYVHIFMYIYIEREREREAAWCFPKDCYLMILVNFGGGYATRSTEVN